MLNMIHQSDTYIRRNVLHALNCSLFVCGLLDTATNVIKSNYKPEFKTRRLLRPPSHTVKDGAPGNVSSAEFQEITRIKNSVKKAN